MRGNNRDHQRQTFGNRHNNNYNREHNRLNQTVDNIHPVGAIQGNLRPVKTMSDKNSLEHKSHSDCNTADVTELAYLVGKVAEFKFKRRVAVVISLQLLRNFSVKSFVAERNRSHNRVTAGNDSPAKNFVRVK